MSTIQATHRSQSAKNVTGFTAFPAEEIESRPRLLLPLQQTTLTLLVAQLVQFARYFRALKLNLISRLWAGSATPFYLSQAGINSFTTTVYTAQMCPIKHSVKKSPSQHGPHCCTYCRTGDHRQVDKSVYLKFITKNPKFLVWLIWWKIPDKQKRFFKC